MEICFFFHFVWHWSRRLVVGTVYAGCNTTVIFAAGKKDKTDTGFQEKNGIRSVRLNPSGTHIASGDRAGNVRYELLPGC